VLPSGV
jgi:hypothetical protein